MNYTKVMRIIAIFALLLLEVSKADDEREKWISDHWVVVNKAKASPNIDSIRELGKIVAPLGRNLDQLKPDIRALFDEAQRTLLSIPGAVNFYGDEIKSLTDGEIDGTSTAHSSIRGLDFEVLSRLPCPETVKILGDLLLDERNPFKDDPTDAPWEASCWGAERSLFYLGLKNMPVKEGPFPFYQDDLRTWQLWYEQIRAGTRTFSFKGDDTVYTLAGPVTEAPASSLQTGHQSTASQPVALPAQSSFPKLPIAVALVILLTSIFAVVIRSKKRRSRQS